MIGRGAPVALLALLTACAHGTAVPCLASLPLQLVPTGTEIVQRSPVVHVDLDLAACPATPADVVTEKWPRRAIEHGTQAAIASAVVGLQAGLDECGDVAADAVGEALFDAVPPVLDLAGGARRLQLEVPVPECAQ